MLLDRGLTQAERRATLAHEIVHAERRHPCRQSSHVEAEVHEVAARRLITLTELAAAMRWTRDLRELAEECWVDDETLRIRVERLTDAERDELARLLTEEEGVA